MVISWIMITNKPNSKRLVIDLRTEKKGEDFDYEEDLELRTGTQVHVLEAEDRRKLVFLRCGILP